MRSFQEEEIPQFGRRDFLKITAVAGLGLIIPAFISCGTKASSSVGDVVSNVTLNNLAKEESFSEIQG